MSHFRPELYAILDALDGGRAIPDELLIWLPLCEVEGLTRYTTEPEDVLPVSYSLTGQPTGTYLELTDAGRQALALRRAALTREGDDHAS